MKSKRLYAIFLVTIFMVSFCVACMMEGESERNPDIVVVEVQRD